MKSINKLFRKIKHRLIDPKKESILDLDSEQSANFEDGDEIWAEKDVPVLGNMLFEAWKFRREGKFDDAIVLYKQMVELIGGTAPVYGNIGLCYRGMGCEKLALEWLGRASDLDPANTAYLWSIAELTAHYGLNDYDQHEKTLRRILEINPNHGRALSAALDVMSSPDFSFTAKEKIDFEERVKTAEEEKNNFVLKTRNPDVLHPEEIEIIANVNKLLFIGDEYSIQAVSARDKLNELNAKTYYCEHDRLRLKEDFMFSEGQKIQAKKGLIGAIVFEPNSWPCELPVKYMIELFDEEGWTLGVPTIEARLVERIEP